MAARQKIEYEPVSAQPVKAFFVSMLTRDIRLEEAILDLLDNCVDGILRSKGHNRSKKPYSGFRASIKFDKSSFSISDNCGGIPWDMHKYAFRMGRAADRPSDPAGTVGVYGIGMKRAIFKMGRSCSIETQSGQHRYDVEIEPAWMSDEEDWQIPVTQGRRRLREDGTTIVIGDLDEGVAQRFHADRESFSAQLRRMIATHYAFIIDKGFQVNVHGKPVKPKPTRLVFSKQPPKRGAPRVQPFVFRATIDSVDVFLAVGFTRPIPAEDEVTGEPERPRYSSIDAGWTIVCNDRAVVYCDRTELTGWGEATIPRYHPQFIAISGVVEFRSLSDASKLPTTTTKRGIDASSRLYLQVKNKMREGMRVFIDYTNAWKTDAEVAKTHIRDEPTLSLEDIKRAASRLRMAKTKRSVPAGDQYKPTLPKPKRVKPRTRRIAYTKPVDDVRSVAHHLFEDEDASPSKVGERCFDIILREAEK